MTSNTTRVHDNGLVKDTRLYVARNREMSGPLVDYRWEVTKVGKQFLEFVEAPQAVQP